MADPVGPGPEPDPAGDDPPGAFMVVPSVILYLVVIAAGYWWLWMRDRTEAIPAAAAGEFGVMVSMAIGIGTGLVLGGVFGILTRYYGPFTRLQDRLSDLVGPLDDTQVTVIALFSAVGEEFFFRLAMQDALGPVLAAIAFALLHVGPKGMFLWTVSALVLGLGFGWMMELGCGLPAVTAAHALVNYTSLRRMEK